MEKQFGSIFDSENDSEVGTLRKQFAERWGWQPVIHKVLMPFLSLTEEQIYLKTTRYVFTKYSLWLQEKEVEAQEQAAAKREAEEKAKLARAKAGNKSRTPSPKRPFRNR